MAGLAVTRLKLSHFRSYRQAELETDGRPVAIYGPNGSGKTNLLEAVSLLSPGRGMRRARTDDLARTPEAIGWRVSCTIENDSTHEVVTGAGPGERRSVSINGKASTQLALARIARIVWLMPSMDRLWIEGAGERRQFLDRVTMSLDPDHAERVIAYEKSMRERNRLLKEQERDPSWYDALETQMAKTGARIISARISSIARLTAAQERGQTRFPKADLSLVPSDGDEAVTEAELAEAFAGNRSRDMAAGRTLVGPHRADLHAIYAEKKVAARLCSTGEQKALLVSLILANATAIAEDAGYPPLVLLDEIAAHLDAGRRADLYDEICALGAQAWMTGTGAELFAELGSRAHHIAVAETGGVSVWHEAQSGNS